MASSVSPDLYREQRYREGKFTCDVCGMQWPMSHHRLHRDGSHVGVVCDFEPEGDELERDLRRAAATMMAGQLSAQELQPPKTPMGQPYSGQPDLIDTEGAITALSPAPIILKRGGAAVAVTVTGVQFISTDAFTYGNAGITNNTAPVLASDTQWNLSLKASAGMPVGTYRLSYTAGGQTDLTEVWQGAISVR